MQHIANIPNITADYFIPLGAACRPAYWLQRLGLRQCALPFDWLELYGFDLIIQTLRDGCHFWFKKYDEYPYSAHTKKVIDSVIPLQSIHAFPANQNVAEYLPTFYNIFERRVQRMRDILTNSKHVCFVCNRDELIDDFISFAKNLHAMYPNVYLTFITVYNKENTFEITEYNPNDFCTIYAVTANDVHPNGATKDVNPFFWHGNPNLWATILSGCRLSNGTQNAVTPVAMRCDIKNCGTMGNNVQVTESSMPIKTPAWLQGDDGGGVMLSGKSRNARITFQVIGNGILKFIFRGPDERANGERFPVWVDYSSIKIDGTEILSAPIQTWHNQPYVFEKNVTDGQIVTMECVQIPHNYTDTELETLINNLSQTPYFIDADIAVLRKYYSNTN